MELLGGAGLGGRCIGNVRLGMDKSTRAGGCKFSSDSEGREKGGPDLSALEQTPSTEHNLGLTA